MVSRRTLGREQAGFSGGLGVFLVVPGDNFGIVAWVRDLDADCLGDVIVGVPGDDTDGANAGGVWVMLLNGQGQAIATSRNGSNVNPNVYKGTVEPRINRLWTAGVDVGRSSGRHAQRDLRHGHARPAAVHLRRDPDLAHGRDKEFVDLQITPGPVANHALMIPNDVNLAGYDVYSQGLIGGGAGPELTNAVDLKLGW